ncbi:hypothetical protein [Psychroflexus sp. ALD_RP9]|uniref:hypothetical protein n=1 Tax=Psychroflexus sp. ALD_RP9 TaxID=2777186 RepID=UPI001A8D9B20|nr:hypothetical protein [Psychroflexus sp. ALD_RP9]QSS96660.1 hypothetical protein IMZ30_09425 [Psychroflexus sp. ALD_RP9]
MNKEEILKKFNITKNDVENFDLDFLSTYLKFHHKKEYGKSSILFWGFDKKEVQRLNEIAISSALDIKKRYSENITFICVNKDFNDDAKLAKAKKGNSIVLDLSEFEFIFKNREYNLLENTDFFPKKEISEIRIPIPLSNFNYEIETESYSAESDKTYKYNLYKQQCECKEFKENSDYEKGDLRRLCKHLLYEYKNSFKPINLNYFTLFLISNDISLKRYLEYFSIGELEFPVYVSYSNLYDWVNIFFPNENGKYKVYGYNKLEKRFSYNDKPIGYVPELRSKLNQIFESKRNKTNKTKSLNNKGKTGCGTSILILIIIVSLISFL